VLQCFTAKIGISILCMSRYIFQNIHIKMLLETKWTTANYKNKENIVLYIRCKS